MSQQKKRDIQFLKAAGRGDFAELEKLMQKGGFSFWSETRIPAANIHACDGSGNNAIHYASDFGHADMIEKLISLKIDRHLANSDGHTPAMMAKNEECVRVILLDATTEQINKRNRKGFTALSKAIYDKRWDVAHALLSMGADPNVSNATMETPLMLAAARADAVMVRALLEAGADVHLRNNHSRTAWHYAANTDTPSTEVCGLLVLAGIDTGILDKGRQKPADRYLTQANDYIKANKLSLALSASMQPAAAQKIITTKPRRKAAAAVTSELQDAFVKNGLDPAKGEHWIAMGESVVENVVGMTPSPNVLSTIFNFESGQTITQRRNLLTGQESAPIVQSMYDYPKQGYIIRAHRQLQAMGKTPPAYEGVEAVKKPRLQPKN